MKYRYGINPKGLHAHLRHRIVNLKRTNLKSAIRFQEDVKPLSKVASKCLDAASTLFTYNGASALLGMRKVHLLDTDSARKVLLLKEDGERHNSLLDVGAGNGDVTDCLSGLFEGNVAAIEVSASCRFALKRRRSISRVLKDMSELDTKERFDVISMLNVLDRCDCPKTMLHSAHTFVQKYLLVSAAYPWVPFSIESGDVLSKWRLGKTKRTFFNDQDLVDASSFEEFINRCETHLFSDTSFEIESISRVPYLCQGTQEVHPEPYELDCALFVLRKSDEKEE